MKKYMMYINIDRIEFSIKVIKAGHHMEGSFDLTVENEQDVFRFNDKYWMSHNRAKLKKFAKEYLTREIDVRLNIVRDLNELRDKI